MHGNMQSGPRNIRFSKKHMSKKRMKHIENRKSAIKKVGIPMLKKNRMHSFGQVN
jgi:hypothetical protein